MMQIQGKLVTDAHLFDTEDRKIRYIADRVGGSAYNHLWPSLQDSDFDTATEAIQFLANIYDDPLKKQKAKQELARLYQGNWSFHKYHAEFARITRTLKMTEEDQKEELVAKLNKEYSIAVLGDDDLSYSQLVKKLHMIDKRIQASQALEKATKPQNTGRNGQQAKDSDRTTPRDVAKAGDSAPTVEKKFPNQRSAEEKALLIEKRLCIKCCRPGHILPTCPEPRSLPFPNHLRFQPRIISRIEEADSEAVEVSGQGKE